MYLLRLSFRQLRLKYSIYRSSLFVDPILLWLFNIVPLRLNKWCLRRRRESGYPLVTPRIRLTLHPTSQRTLQPSLEVLRQHVYVVVLEGLAVGCLRVDRCEVLLDRGQVPLVEVHRRGELTLIIVQLHTRTGTIVRREVRRWRRLRHRAARKWRARRDLILVYAEKFTHVLLPIPPLTFFLHLATGLFRDLLYCSWDQTVVLAQVKGHRCKDRKRVLLLPRNQLFFALDWLFGLIILLIYGRFRVVWVLGWEGLTGVAVATRLDWSWLGSVFRTWGVHLG